MYKDKTFLAIIPARGGSKRLPRKNVLTLNGKPLIVWSIEAGLQSKYIDKVVVTSDDEEILEISKKFRAETISRPDELASDTATTFDAIKHTIDNFEKYDYIVLLQPTSPLRNEKHVDKAIELLESKNADAITRLIQLGELPSSIFILGSPDLDLMNPAKLPKLSDVKNYYNIEFDNFAIAMFHPVTTEFKSIQKDAKEFVNSLIDSDENYIIIYPNNDLGSHEILNEYKRLKGNSKIRLFPSLRFEYFLALLKNANYIVGNSSVGIREASYYGTPTVDIGSRQNNRSQGASIFRANNEKKSILKAINLTKNFKNNITIKGDNFGEGNSDKIFLKLLNSNKIWSLDCQKQFQDLEYE